MDAILQILDQSSPVSMEDLRSMVQGIVGNPDMVKEYVPDDLGGNFLHRLAKLSAERQLEVLPLFYLAVVKGVDVNAQDDKENTPLHYIASNNGHHKALLALVRLGAMPYFTNDIGKNPKESFKDPEMQNFYERFIPTLWDAVDKGDSEMVESRLESWCFPVPGKNSDGEVQTLIDLAKDNSKEDVIGVLEAYSETLEFVLRVLAADLDEAQKYLEKGGLDDININIQEAGYLEELSAKPYQRPLLVTIIQDVRLPEVVEYIVKKGADLSLYFEGFFPPGPTFFITEYSHPKLPEEMSLAVLKNADLGLKNYRAKTILYEAQTRSPDYAKKILKLGVDIADRDQEGHTVVDNVLFNGLFHLLPTYYEHLISLMNTDGVTNMEKLVLNGYDYIANTVDGFDALKIAKEKGLADVAKFLEGAPKMFTSIKSIHESVRVGNPEGAKALLTDKLALAKDKGGRNVLHLAILHGQREFVEYLFYQYPATISGRDNFRRTPLHYAAASGDHHMYHALVKAGAEDSLKDCHNLSPLDYLSELERPNITPEERAQAENNEEFLVRGMMERERAMRYGLKVYLKLQYDSLKKKIEDGDIEGAKTLIEAFEANIDDFVEEKITDKPLLFTCIDHKAEEIAIHLINNGANPQVTWVHGRDTHGFVESVYKAELKNLYNVLIEKLGINTRPWSASSESSYSSSQVQVPCRPRANEGRRKFAEYPTRLDAKYLASHMGHCLQMALSEIAEKRPWDPIEYLAQWLYKHAENTDLENMSTNQSYLLAVEKAEYQKDTIRQKRQVKEAEKIRRDEAERRRRVKENEEREKKKAEEEEKRLKELEELQKKQREGGETYSQAPDLDTVTEEEAAENMDTRRLSLKNGSLPPAPPEAPQDTSANVQEGIKEEPEGEEEDPPAES